jgi:hypothetical protein
MAAQDNAKKNGQDLAQFVVDFDKRCPNTVTYSKCESLMCKIFRPSGDAYGCLSVSEVTWSGVLGLNYHSQYEGKDCHCVNCDRWNYDGIVF